MQKRKLALLTVAVAGAAAVVTSVSGATATAAPASVLAGGQCTGSWVNVYDTVAAKARPDASSNTIFTITVSPGYYKVYPCRKIVVGTGYGACGYTGVNGWILVQDQDWVHDGTPGWSGYIPSVCTADR
jgi:hypothetical protein